MVTGSLADVRWLDWRESSGLLDEIFSVSFLHKLGPEEVLRRFGAGPGRRMGWAEFGERVTHFLEYEDTDGGGAGGGYVGVIRAGEWSVAVEPYGWQATLSDVARRLSVGSETVAVTRHDYAEHSFVHAADGVVMTGIKPDLPCVRHGSEPDRLNALMPRVGLDPHERVDIDIDEPIAAAFALAAQLTGVTFTSRVTGEALHVGALRP